METNDLSRSLSDFGQVAGEVLRDVKDITEQQIRHWIVNPFLTSLGWDPHDKRQVFLDYVTPGRKDPVDYALLDATGKPKLFLDVRERSASVTEAGTIADRAKEAHVPLILLTNGRAFSLWFVPPDEAATPLLVLSLEELALNAEGLLGLTAEYRLSDSGILQLRRSAIRLPSSRCWKRTRRRRSTRS